MSMLNEISRSSDLSALQTCCVRLCRASLPIPVGWIADHCWFTHYDAVCERWHRWEVWQDADAGGKSWGHVHQNLMDPGANIGGGPCIVVREWSGEEAGRLMQIIQATPEEYPHRNRYWPWPGPNSNTYVAWVLQRAGFTGVLGRRALGKNYR